MHNSNVSVEKNVGGIVVGDNTHVTNNINKYDQDFLEIPLEKYGLGISPSQQLIDEMINIICHHRMLILGGSNDIDKVGIARNFAWHLSNHLQKEYSSSDSFEVEAKEWQRGSELLNFDQILEQTETRTIFVLTQVVPQDIDYDLSLIQKAAADSNHYVIFATDEPRAVWGLTDTIGDFWKDLEVDGLYKKDDLSKELKDQLKQLPWSLPDKISIESIAEKLKTPDKIYKFVELLSTEKEPLNPEEIDQLINLAQDNKKILERWFNNVLQPREKLIALGLNFFDGLFEDQCLVAIGQLADHEWYRRDSSLCALDHCDLQPFHNFFRPVEVKNDRQKRIESWLPEQRLELFKIAWNTYRQRIYAALPVLVKLVKTSVKRGVSRKKDTSGIPVGQQLYGSLGEKTRRYPLRTAISGAISDIGLIDTDVVKETLLRLATYGEEGVTALGVQAVAARAMARWHKLEQKEQLLQTIRYLYQENFSGIEENKKNKLKQNVRATIALTISYAAKSDPPGKLTEGFQEWLIKLLSDNHNSLVLERFRDQILRMLIPQHLFQLQEVLCTLVQREYGKISEDLTEKIISEFKSAYYNNHAYEVLDILEQWHTKCEPSEIQYFVEEPQITSRERLLITVVKTYGEIQDKKVLKQLYRILTIEEHPDVREEAIEVLCQWIEEAFQKIISVLPNFLPSLFEELDKYEQLRVSEEIINIFDSAYHTNHAAEVLDILEQWHTKCEQCEIEYPVEEPQITSRNQLLITVVKTYGEILDEKVIDPLYRILTIEEHPDVREKAIKVLCQWIEEDFQQIKHFFPNLFKKLNKYEKSQVFEALPESYWEEEGLSVWTLQRFVIQLGNRNWKNNPMYLIVILTAVSVIGILLVVSSIFFTSNKQQGKCKVVHGTKNHLPVRDYPDLNHPQKEQFKNGQQVTAIGKPNSGFYEITAPIKGWVAANYLKECQ
ncbi:MAG: hypothetical protein F6K37_06385 [Moorea sp. SIO4E2]|uniref:SH3 domain-containing protein n=1 Tax=Moorena sp. SIO4E2 TaxID=2607826 RepID=UPI0013B70D95|nr:SH3 domain-containing protein [Moorena sp. SIO4E2]NEQ05605.1 hypothetical protein [Moorena sp. SIO4E2]